MRLDLEPIAETMAALFPRATVRHVTRLALPHLTIYEGTRVSVTLWADGDYTTNGQLTFDRILILQAVLSAVMDQDHGEEMTDDH